MATVAVVSPKDPYYCDGKTKSVRDGQELERWSYLRWFYTALALRGTSSSILTSTPAFDSPLSWLATTSEASYERG